MRAGWRSCCGTMLRWRCPRSTWFTGRQTVTSFLAAHFLTEPGGLRLVPVTANGERAFAVYRREPGQVYHAHALLVPTVTARGSPIVAFQDQGLFDRSACRVNTVLGRTGARNP